MIDPFVVLAPVLLLGIVALLRFVGCSFTRGMVTTSTPTPGNLVATPGNGKVILTWDSVGAGASYQLTRTDGNPIPPVTDNFYTDTNVMNGTTYCYTVSATVSGSLTSGLSNQACATPAALLGRPPGSVVDPGNPLSNNLIGLFLMNEGSGTTDKNLVDGQLANFSGTSLPTWNTADPSIQFNGGGSLNSYLDAGETGSASAFDQLPISQMTVVAKVFVNAPLAPGGVCEKNDNNTADGFLFGWDSAGVLRLTVEKNTSVGAANMRVATAGGAVVSGQWMQLAFTWDGTPGHGTAADAHLFLNGAEQAKASAQDGSGTLGYANATNQPFRIGNASYDPMAGSLNGKMAYLAIYKGRILTPGEMTQLETNLPIK